MRTVALTALKSGIQRLREKSGASPDSLFDLINGYVTAQRTVRARHDTIHEQTLPSGTKGLTAFGGKLVVFATVPTTIGNELYEVEVVVHPTEPGMQINEILFAEPFLGYLYVVVEFVDGSTHHYWLQRRDPWAANTAYAPGDVVEPTVRNGFAYRARRVDTDAVLQWAPNVARAIDDMVEPTTASGYEHVVIAVAGPSPRSGATEPVWATEDGGITIEDADAPPSTTVLPTTSPTPTTGLPDDTLSRYDFDPVLGGISFIER